MLKVGADDSQFSGEDDHDGDGIRREGEEGATGGRRRGESKEGGRERERLQDVWIRVPREDAEAVARAVVAWAGSGSGSGSGGAGAAWRILGKGSWLGGLGLESGAMERCRGKGFFEFP